MHKAKSIYRFVALFMASLIFVTSVGFTVDMHFCNGEFKSFSLLGKAKSCHEQSMVECPHHKKMMTENDQVNTNDCCNNTMLHFQSDQDKAMEIADFISNQNLQTFTIALVHVFFSEEKVDTNRSSFLTYRPPLIPRDIYVLTQSFLL